MLFEQQHPVAGATQHIGARESGEPTANDDDIVRVCNAG
jgi:hypothetical protein